MFLFSLAVTPMNNNPPMQNEGNKYDKAERVESASPRLRRRPLPKDFEPTLYNVIIGRGKISANAVGNRRLTVLAESFLPQYIRADNKRKEKSGIVSRVIAAFQEANPDGPAFIKYEDGQWWEADGLSIREKVGTVFRNLLHDNYRSSSKSKVSIRRNRRQKKLDAEDDKKPPAAVDPPVHRGSLETDDYTTVTDPFAMADEHHDQEATLDPLGHNDRVFPQDGRRNVACPSPLSSAPISWYPQVPLSASLKSSNAENDTNLSIASLPLHGFASADDRSFDRLSSSSGAFSPFLNLTGGDISDSQPVQNFGQSMPHSTPGGTVSGQAGVAGSFIRSHASSQLLLQSGPFRPPTEPNNPILFGVQQQASHSSESDDLSPLDEKELPPGSSNIESAEYDISDIFEEPGGK